MGKRGPKSRSKVAVGKNDLMTLRPDLAACIIEPNPMSISPWSLEWATWFCSAGHIYEKIVRDRAQSLQSCPYCYSKNGYKDHLLGYLYLLTHSRADAAKIGISNNPQKRLATHLRRGWVIVDTLGPLDGTLAQDYESLILGGLRSRGIDVGGHRSGVPSDGHTETWRISEFPALTIRELMENLNVGV